MRGLRPPLGVCELCNGGTPVTCPSWVAQAVLLCRARVCGLVRDVVCAGCVVCVGCRFSGPRPSSWLNPATRSPCECFRRGTLRPDTRSSIGHTPTSGHIRGRRSSERLPRASNCCAQTCVQGTCCTWRAASIRLDCATALQSGVILCSVSEPAVCVGRAQSANVALVASVEADGATARRRGRWMGRCRYIPSLWIHSTEVSEKQPEGLSLGLSYWGNRRGGDVAGSVIEEDIIDGVKKVLSPAQHMPPHPSFVASSLRPIPRVACILPPPAPSTTLPCQLRAAAMHRRGPPRQRRLDHHKAAGAAGRRPRDRHCQAIVRGGRGG